MQRARPGVTDVLRPLVLLLVVVGTAGCGTTTPPTAGAPSATLPTTAISASPSLTPPASEEPTPSPSVPVGPSSAPPTETSSPAITPTPTPGAGAAACSGSSQTKDFFTAIAEAVQWPVFCAVLPSGWSVDRGSGNTYALANGGRMVIGYHSNAGLHLELREGRWCTESASACSPHAQDLGSIALGDLDGELMTLASGGYVVYVDPGQAPSWTVTGTGMDEAAFRNLVAALALVRV